MHLLFTKCRGLRPLGGVSFAVAGRKAQAKNCVKHSYATRSDLLVAVVVARSYAHYVLEHVLVEPLLYMVQYV